MWKCEVGTPKLAFLPGNFFFEIVPYIPSLPQRETEELVSLNIFSKREVEDICLRGTGTYALHSVGEWLYHKTAGFLEKRQGKAL